MRNRVKRFQRSRGLTLIELLIVISIIALLLSLLGVVAAIAVKGAKIKRTEALLTRIHGTLAAHHAKYKNYPTDDPTCPGTWPSPYHPAGVAFDSRWLEEHQELMQIGLESRDPSAKQFILDAWGQRLRYRKLSPSRVLVWSSGPDGVDQIGADLTGRKENAGDDLSSNQADF